MRFAAPFLFSMCLMAPAAHAQQDSFFQSYDDYAAFVDKSFFTRDFVPLILRLGGRDEYTPEQLAKNNADLNRAWPRPFEQVTVFRREDLGGGFSQEARAYWTGAQYAYFYALLHQRDDAFVVISFRLNTSSKAIMERF